MECVCTVLPQSGAKVPAESIVARHKPRPRGQCFACNEAVERIPSPDEHRRACGNDGKRHVAQGHAQIAPQSGKNAPRTVSQPPDFAQVLNFQADHRRHGKRRVLDRFVGSG